MGVQKGWVESNQALNPASKILNSASSSLRTWQYDTNTEELGKFLSYDLASFRSHDLSWNVLTHCLCLSLANPSHVPGISNIPESLLHFQLHLELYTSTCQKFPTSQPSMLPQTLPQTPRVSFEIWVEAFRTHHHLYLVSLQNSHALSNSDKQCGRCCTQPCYYWKESERVDILFEFWCLYVKIILKRFCTCMQCMLCWLDFCPLTGTRVIWERESHLKMPPSV